MKLTHSQTAAFTGQRVQEIAEVLQAQKGAEHNV